MTAKLTDKAQADLDSARRVLTIEISALEEVSRRLGEEFAQAVEILASIEGKVVVTGLGKSGLICRKMAATLASTGTPALFLHAAEGLHGDIGMLARGDALIAVSNSGSTEEVVGLVAPARRLGLPVIALTGETDAPLSRAADVCLSIAVAEEACPLGLAPTASTTVTLAIGDALAIALLERGGFAANDFGTLHPGGALGRRLRKVDDLMHREAQLPSVSVDAPMREVFGEMTTKKLGVTCVVDVSGCLVGIITDGDLRRAAEVHGDLRGLAASDVMTSDPKTIPAGAVAEQAVAVMEDLAITALFIVDEQGHPCGAIKLLDLLRAGVV
ncbi:MAG: KpsF/GutQ family sugar-phosphate isomerase [Candidatus Binatia bacterium]|nr:KpsF/GutQ family sugar-phosphate isomerase [Candidatus Binatia bacterium]MDG2010046.1 KpsF/GutQ family sugar-phosphate isomerase [Candidatus Binatia bacterium]HAC80879.1 D-arabinose 5-phosphate isomerase [Deltaproteobacteria bacterium]